MSQPVQVFDVTASGLIDIGQQSNYSVIDNGAAGNFNGIPGAPGYDRTIFAEPGAGGALAQGTNTYSNGNIPDAIATASTTITAAVAASSGVNGGYGVALPTAVVATIMFKNPA